MAGRQDPDQQMGGGSPSQTPTELYGAEDLADLSPGELLRLYEEEAPDRIEAAAPVGHWMIELDGRRMTWSRGLQRLPGTDGSPQWETAEELRRIVHPRIARPSTRPCGKRSPMARRSRSSIGSRDRAGGRCTFALPAGSRTILRAGQTGSSASPTNSSDWPTRHEGPGGHRFCQVSDVV